MSRTGSSLEKNVTHGFNMEIQITNPSSGLTEALHSTQRYRKAIKVVKTFYMLIGPKGSGKNYIGTLVEKKTDISFLYKFFPRKDKVLKSLILLYFLLTFFNGRDEDGSNCCYS